MNTIALFKHLRPINLFIVALTMLMVTNMLSVSSTDNLSFYFCNFLAFSTICVCAWGYIDNDICDIGIDSINKNKPIDLVGLRKMWYFLGALCVISTLIITCFSHLNATLNVIVIGLLLYYNKYAKRQFLIGNLIVATLCALVLYVPYIYVQKISTVDSSKLGYINIYALFSFLITFIREIVKDMEDTEGDEAMGARTIPIVVGIYWFKWLLGFTIVLLMYFFIYFGAALFFSLPLFLSFIIFILFFFLSMYLLYLLNISKTKKDFARMSLVLKLIMLSGLLFSLSLFVV